MVSRHLNQSHAGYSVVLRELYTIQYFHGKINFLLKRHAQLQLCPVPDMADIFNHKFYVHSMIPFRGQMYSLLTSALDGGARSALCYSRFISVSATF